MFLDPDPRPPKHSAAMSGFSSSQNPTSSPRDTLPSRRVPLHERTKSQNNQRNLSRGPEKPTVRLVKPSPAPESPTFREHDRGSSPSTIEGDRAGDRGTNRRLGTNVSGLKAGFASSNWTYNVSDSSISTNQTQRDDRKSLNPLRSPPTLQFVPVASPWHRRSTSSGYNSESSTLKESEFAFSQKSRKSERLSEGTTLRGTLTPSELEFHARSDDNAAPKLILTDASQSLPEVSSERPTIRAVTPSIASSPRSDTRPGTGVSGPSHVRYHSVPSDSPPSSTPVSRSNSNRTSSTGSAVPVSLEFHTPNVIRVPTPRAQRSDESIRSSELALSSASSPNYVAYSPDSVRPRSRSQPLREIASYDSINSRLQATRVTPLDLEQSIAASPSLVSQSSNDTLPSLQLPRKRYRNASTQASLGYLPSSSPDPSSSVSPDDFDTLPYRRQGFQSQLSTIASVSDQQSRTTSQQLSHFSLGSGVSTVDDGDRTTLSGTWPTRERVAVPPQSLIADSISTVAADSSSGDEPGDMTLGIFREESAKPPPLFTDSTLGDSTIILPGSQRLGAPSLMHPPLSKDGERDETFDTLTALQSVSLRPKRSGISLRQRSNSTPSVSHSRQQSMASYVDSERWSYGSNLFPMWAKHYYAGTAVLSSKVSVNATLVPRDRPFFHSRNSSTWTERSIASRVGTSYSHIESMSPESSAILPSIFRPKTRRGFRMDESRRSSRRSWSTRSRNHTSQPSSTVDAESRPDSMAILPDPLPPSEDEIEPDTLPSGQPRWGSLKDEPRSSPPPRRSLPRDYDRQKEWNTMDFPRPMTKDQPLDFSFAEPHLAPSRRQTQPRLSVWRPPSFVESLDTLIHSRCNRQILLFGLGFLCPLLWMLGATLPLPKRPLSAEELGESLVQVGDDQVQVAMVKHEATDAERRWREERTFLKARWWRVLNRVMSVVGVLVIGAVIALVIVATH